MLFFRSEERVREWCSAHGYPLRPLVRIDQLWTLATTWYATRLQENSRRPQPAEMRAIFAGLGLEGDFWDPRSDSFGWPRANKHMPLAAFSQRREVNIR